MRPLHLALTCYCLATISWPLSAFSCEIMTDISSRLSITDRCARSETATLRIAPAVLRLVAQDTPCFLDREECLV